MTGPKDGLTQWAYCWALQRPDGGGAAMTSHDGLILHDGIEYHPSPGMTPYAAQFREGLESDDGEVSGALSSRGITAADLDAGHWDGARADLIGVDWESGQALPSVIACGDLGRIHRRDDAFDAAITGVPAKLEAAPCPQTQPTCRAALGDRACRIDLAGRRFETKLLAVAGNRVTLEQAATSDHRFGRLTFLEGQLRGSTTTILAIENDDLVLRDSPRGPVTPPMRVRIEEGCDRLFSTCRSRFSNARNFRGEPHLPGRDLLTRYPGA